MPSAGPLGSDDFELNLSDDFTADEPLPTETLEPELETELESVESVEPETETEET